MKTPTTATCVDCGQVVAIQPKGRDDEGVTVSIAGFGPVRTRPPAYAYERHPRRGGDRQACSASGLQVPWKHILPPEVIGPTGR